MKLLYSSIVLKKELSDLQRKEMWQLFNKYHAFTDQEVFFKDLEDKTHVILLNDNEGALRGFKAIHKYHFLFQGKMLNIVYSGNAIIHPEFWGSQEFVRTFTQFMSTSMSERPDLPLYWFLICSGFRTYRSLSIFFTEFYPKFDRPTPSYEKKLMEALATTKFPEEYRDGMVHVKEKKDSLLEELANPKNRNNPHIKYFLKKNPNFRKGNELVCLAEFSIENTRGLAKKMAKETLYSCLSLK